LCGQNLLARLEEVIEDQSALDITCCWSTIAAAGAIITALSVHKIDVSIEELQVALAIHLCTTTLTAVLAQC
jgi:hypothetical protein